MNQRGVLIDVVSLEEVYGRENLLTSVNAITSLPNLAPSPLLNFTFRTHQPGAFVPRVHSHGSSDSHPLAPPFPTAAEPSNPLPRVLLVWNTFIGFVLLTSHTATTPSWLATANLLPSPLKAVEKAAAKEVYDDGGYTGDDDDEYARGEESGGGMVSVVIGWNVIRAPPVIWWKYILLESPTERRVRPSGEIDATRRWGLMIVTTPRMQL